VRCYDNCLNGAALPGLGQAGLDGGLDELRARAYLDLLLGKDSRPHRETTAGGGGQGPTAPGGPPPAGPGTGTLPAGFAGRVTLTVPLGTAAGLADRPGELAGLGPIDPWLARDLAAAAAQNPKTTWCVTVTDQHGHAIGHGCARPEPKSHRKRAEPRPGGFSFTPASRDGPTGGYGTWRLRVPGGGPDLIVTLDPLWPPSSSAVSSMPPRSAYLPCPYGRADRIRPGSVPGHWAAYARYRAPCNPGGSSQI
jgi:hypothetical protein